MRHNLYFMQFQPHASSDALKMAEIATGHAFCDR